MLPWNFSAQDRVVSQMLRCFNSDGVAFSSNDSETTCNGSAPGKCGTPPGLGHPGLSGEDEAVAPMTARPVLISSPASLVFVVADCSVVAQFFELLARTDSYELLDDASIRVQADNLRRNGRPGGIFTAGDGQLDRVRGGKRQPCKEHCTTEVGLPAPNKPSNSDRR